MCDRCRGPRRCIMGFDHGEGTELANGVGCVTLGEFGVADHHG